MLYIKELTFLLLLLAVFIGSVADVVHDWSEGAGKLHMMIEFMLVGASFMLIGILGVNVWRQNLSNRRHP